MQASRKNGFSVMRHNESPLSHQSLMPEGRSSRYPLIPVLLQNTLPPSVLEAIQAAYMEKGGERIGYLEEIRLRADRMASLTVNGINLMMELVLSTSELFSILTQMCGGSLYAYSQSINEGFMTLEGGIRVGVVGEATCEHGYVVGVREISALCIRIPHVHGRVGAEIARLFRSQCGEQRTGSGILLYAPPGEGKTTLLRGIAAQLASGPSPLRTVVVDTRGELTFPVEAENLCIDVLTGYPKHLGIGIAAKSLNAQVIICDEIGDGREITALLAACLSGVPILATTHAGSVAEIFYRTGLRQLHKAGLFGAYIGIKRDGKGDFLYDITPREEVLHVM